MILNCGYELGEVVNDETVSDPFIVVGEECKNNRFTTMQDWYPITNTVEIKPHGIIVHDWDSIDTEIQEEIEDKHNVVSRVVE